MFGAAELIIDKEAYEMNTVWKYVKPLEEEEAIKTFLAEKNINLPGTLITLLERYNGGRPSDKDFETKSGREYVFKSLLSYNRGDRETIYDVYDALFSDKTLFPIGSDAAGNIVCYNTVTGRYELYNHETDSTEEIINLPFLV